MDKQQAKTILGDRARFELVNMRRALLVCPFLNSPDENRRLEAVEIMLKA